jgi:hypothetical protein
MEGDLVGESLNLTFLRIALLGAGVGSDSGYLFGAAQLSTESNTTCPASKTTNASVTSTLRVSFEVRLGTGGEAERTLLLA